jgi:hypothetical protein
MRARYNGFTFPEGRWSISKTISSNENAAKQEITVIHRVDIDGRLQGTSPSQIEAQYNLLNAAYSVNGFDFTVFLPTGGLSNRLSLSARDAIGGVRVVQKPSIGQLENGQYVTYLPVKISLEAEYGSDNAPINALVSFQENLRFDGGGPISAWYRPIKGRPTKGMVRQADTYRAVQSGSAVGFSDYPQLGTISGAPPPIFGINMLNKNPDVNLGTPELRGRVYINWPIEWTYEFESSSPLFGTPNRWPTF